MHYGCFKVDFLFCNVYLKNRNVNHLENLKQNAKPQKTRPILEKMLDEGDPMFKKIYYIIL